MRLAWLAVLALGATVQAADIDTDGFLQDGQTTYCQAVTNEQRPLEFFSLSTSSAGKCPVTIEMNVTAPSYTMMDSTFDVTWTASLAKTNASLFPGVVDKTSGLPADIVGTALRACRVGSNCLNSSDVYAASVHGKDTSIGSFQRSRERALGTFSFVLPHSTQFTIVGKITIRGTTGAVDFVVFQRVQTSSFGRNTPGTVRPREADEPPANKTKTNSSAATGTPEPTWTRHVVPTTAPSGIPLPPVEVDAQGDGSVGFASSSSSSSTKSMLLVGIIACVALVGATVFVVTARVHKKLSDGAPESDALDDREVGPHFAPVLIPPRSSSVPNLREQRQTVEIQQRVDLHQGQFEMYPQQLYSFAASSEDERSSLGVDSSFAGREDLSVSRD